MIKYLYIVDKCYITPYHDICSYETPEEFETESDAINYANKYAFLLDDNEVYSVERHIIYPNDDIEYDKEIVLISNIDGE